MTSPIDPMPLDQYGLKQLEGSAFYSEPNALRQAIMSADVSVIESLERVLHPEKTGLDLYCPHTPWPKQQEFLDLECLEGFYGGAAGPGKTDALLMAALQYVHVPGYSALIVRRDFARLALPSSIMDRARQWLFPHKDVRWNQQEKTARFPSGAVLQFGFIDSPDDRYRYASSEYQFIGWDELTEFRLSDDETNAYLFLMSRLRRTKGLDVPLRMRSASNPGNISHKWVKRRFITDDAIAGLLDDKPHTYYADAEKTRAFVPALLEDNPSIDAEEYSKNLMHLPPVTRARLMKGDWSIQEHSIIKAEWLRRFTMRGEIIVALNREGKAIASIDCRELRRFITVDTAGTSKQRAEELKGNPPSYSVAGVWDYWAKHHFLFLRDLWRDQVDYIDLKEAIREITRDWRPGRVHIENAHFGPALHVELLKEGLPVELMNTVTKGMRGQSGSGQPGKLERAAPMLNMLDKGQIFLPEVNNSWLVDLESEWLSWTGMPEETADQIDVGAYAADLVSETGGGSTRVDFAFWK